MVHVYLNMVGSGEILGKFLTITRMFTKGCDLNWDRQRRKKQMED